MKGLIIYFFMILKCKRRKSSKKHLVQKYRFDLPNLQHKSPLLLYLLLTVFCLKYFHTEQAILCFLICNYYNSVPENNI